MRLEDVKEVVGGTPHMSLQQAQRMTRHILEHGPSQVLELGFRHGVSSCYIAAALHELGQGHLTMVDLSGARSASPNIEELLDRLGLRDFVTVHYEPTSYVWRLMRMLEADPQPRFDLCYIDGAHDWYVDGFAFFLVDRLLEPNGWLVLDDLDWSYASSPSLSGSAETAALPEEERETAHVRQIWELLVKPHPSYGEFSEEGTWAFARKLAQPAQGERTVVVERIRERYGAGQFLASSADRLIRWSRARQARS